MKKILNLALTVSIAFTSVTSAFSTPQTPPKTETSNVKFTLPKRNIMLPPDARIGSTPECRAAYEKLTPEQQQKARELLRARMEKVISKAKEQQSAKPPIRPFSDFVNSDGNNASSTNKVMIAFTDEEGNQNLIEATERDASEFTASAVQKPFSPPVNFKEVAFTNPSYRSALSTPIVQSGDADADGLDDTFENQVADAFTPVFGISTEEPDGFARFGNFVPQTVQQVFNPIPPISNFRVQPLGFATHPSGVQYGYLRVDYLTLWNHDSGLVGGGWPCYYSVFGLDNLVQQLNAHNLDNERSAALIAAPSVGGTFNPDPNAYALHSFYTAAHETTFFSKNQYADFSPAVPAGNHINLALARSKHAVYTFDPNYLPLFPLWFILQVENEIRNLYWDGFIDYDTYLYLRYLANNVFYACVVERFGNQGGWFAQTRINVGEPNTPINESGYIRDTELYNKLTTPLW